MNWVYISDMKQYVGEAVTLKGWIANKRESKGLTFVILRDGSGFCQVVFSEQVLKNSYAQLKQLTQESAIEVFGEILKDDRQIGGYELQASSFKILHLAEEYPITPKEHGVDFLLENRHLWLRSKKQWAIMRVRNALIFNIHQYFHDNGFILMDSPILTGSAAEGTTDLFSTDYFGNTAYLAQTGQLYGEAMAMAHGKIYTFGPTFRAEKSKTRRHLTEFWMIEPEMAFYDLEMNMDLIEDFLRTVVLKVVNECENELSVLDRDIDALKSVSNVFPRITYNEAVEILTGKKEIDGVNAIKLLEEDLLKIKSDIKACNDELKEREKVVNDSSTKKGVKNFNRNQIGQLKSKIKDLEEAEKNIPSWISSAKNFQYGSDLGGSDETVLTRLFGCPIMVYNWPSEIKAFYMKRVEGNENFVKGVDVLAPEGYGEIVGGSERETNLDYLVERIKHENLSIDDYQWYLDLRRFGSVPHAGFGLGLERLLTWICNLKHIREAIPFPRTSQRLYP